VNIRRSNPGLLACSVSDFDGRQVVETGPQVTSHSIETRDLGWDLREFRGGFKTQHRFMASFRRQ
jgi:hypothetical protein